MDMPCSATAAERDTDAGTRDPFAYDDRSDNADAEYDRSVEAELLRVQAVEALRRATALNELIAADDAIDPAFRKAFGPGAA
jgi:hypothetical protein